MKGNDWQGKYFRKATRVDGKYVCAYGKTEKEAKKNLDIKVAKIKAGQIELAGTMTVSEWYEKYRSIYRTKQAESTNRNYHYKVRKFLLDEIGNKPLKLVKPIDLQQIMNSMDGYSDDYIKKVYEYINDIFSKAVDNDLILKNPMRSVVRPTGGKESHRDITEQERDALLALGKQKHEYLYFLLMYYCGCRPAEAGSVLGGDIKDGFLHIRGTKTSKADRYVPIPNSLQAYMEKRVSPGVNIVTREKGPMSVYDRRKLWKAFQADIDEYMLQQTGRGKAKDLVPYCFRHAYCCTLLRANIPLRTAMTLMGHTDYKMILTVYQHTDDKMLDEAADLINAVV